MLTIFVKNGCPYSRKVLDAVEALHVPVAIKNLKEDGVVDELITLGGKRQVPFLHDEAEGVSMYESSDIVRYLCQRFGGDPAHYDKDVAHLCQGE